MKFLLKASKLNDFFSKGDQQHLPKMGQILFLIRWCFRKMGGWSTKKRIGDKLVEKTEKFQ
jgi:hypothetical protein